MNSKLASPREMCAAHYAVATAKKRGTLVPKPCAVCGTSVRVNAHHDDYSKPLKVMWLCPKHHRERHTKMGRRVTGAGLRIINFNDDLMARLKSTAALDRLSIREFIEKIVADALRRRKGERVK